MDERNFKKSLIDSCKEDVDILVLGSSRIMLLSEQMLNGESLLNLGVSGATYEDIAALFYHYIQTSKGPRKVIIGIDPQHFNANIGDTRWKTLRKEYMAYSKDILSNDVLVTPNFEKWENLISITYFQSAVRIGNESHRLKPGDAIISEDSIEYGCGYRDDGSLIYGRSYHNTPQDITNNLAKTEFYPQWDKYSELSKDEIDRWRRLIQYMKEKDIQVCLFNAAYHPIMYQRFMNDAKLDMMRQAMDYIHKFEIENDVEMIGSFNPNDNNFNLKEGDFYDGMHMRREVVEKILVNSNIDRD